MNADASSRASNTGRLSGKSALVTAAANGIGRATALAFAREGASVLATDINEDALADLHGRHGIAVRRLDVTDRAGVAALAESFPAPDVLFNCAGFVHHGDVLACDEAAFDLSWDLNVKSMYRMVRAFLPGMVADGGGCVINVASVASSIIGAPNRFAYGTTKAAVIGLTRSISADYVAAGIRACAICPGTIDTPSLRGRIEALGDAVAARQAFLARQPAGRFGSPEEVAGLAVYLASDEGAFMAGTAIVMDGGWSNV